MKKFLGLTVLALACAPAFAQDATLTARESGSGKTIVSGGTLPDSVCFYGGDFDTRNGLTSDRGTAVADSWTFDDFTWAGGTISSGFSKYLDTGIGAPVGADLAVYSGLGEGTFGTLMGQAVSASAVSVATGGSGFGYPEMKMTVTLGGQAFALAAGTYHVGIRPVGSGVGQTWVVTASGTNGVGAPLSNGNTFLQSNYFGYPLPTDWRNLLGSGNWDVSYGIDCGGGGGCPSDFTATKSGSCPSSNMVSWTGAPSNSVVRVLYTTNNGSGGNIPSGPCAGKQLCIGLGGITLHAQRFNSPSGSGNTPNFTAPCGLNIQLITETSCKTSNKVTL